MRRDDRPMIRWSGVVYRATTYDTPLWVNPNRRGGRWNRPGQGETQYFCLDAEAPYAEMLRGEDLRSQEQSDMFSTTLWQLRVDEGAIIDYSSFARAEAAGFPADALVDDDPERCRTEAGRLRGLGLGGVLAPSAALPGSINLTLFGPRVEVAWSTEVTLASMVPAQRLATGSAPPGLVSRVRFWGDRHNGLDQYRAARRRSSDDARGSRPRDDRGSGT